MVYVSLKKLHTLDENQNLQPKERGMEDRKS